MKARCGAHGYRTGSGRLVRSWLDDHLTYLEAAVQGETIFRRGPGSSTTFAALRNERESIP